MPLKLWESSSRMHRRSSVTILWTSLCFQVNRGRWLWKHVHPGGNGVWRQGEYGSIFTALEWIKEGVVVEFSNAEYRFNSSGGQAQQMASFQSASAEPFTPPRSQRETKTRLFPPFWWRCQAKWELCDNPTCLTLRTTVEVLLKLLSGSLLRGAGKKSKKSQEENYKPFLFCIAQT